MLFTCGYSPLYEKEWANLILSKPMEAAASSETYCPAGANVDAEMSASHPQEVETKALRLTAGSLSGLLNLPPWIADTPVDKSVVPDADDYYQWSTPSVDDLRVANATISALGDGPISRVLQTTGTWKTLAKLAKSGVMSKKTGRRLFMHHSLPYDKKDSVKPWLLSCVKILGAYPPGQAVRDFFASWVLWSHAGTMTPREAVACGKVGTIATAADYVGTEDGMAGLRLSAFAEGIGNACGGEGDYAHAVDLMKASGSLIEMRNRLTAGMMKADITDTADEWVGPHEFMAARWWDGAMLASFNVARAVSPTTASLMVGACGNGSITVCAKAWNALDAVAQYNETLDMISDDVSGEPLNELLAAAKFGGGSDPRRYHAVIASAVVDVFECRCGGPGHEWSRRAALGSAAWYALAPRYGGPAQQRAMRIVHNASVWDHDVFCNTPPVITRGEPGAYCGSWVLTGVDSVVDAYGGCQACTDAVRHLNARCSLDGHIFTADELHAAVTEGDVIALVCRVGMLGQCPGWLVEPVMAIGKALSDTRGDLENDARLYVVLDLALGRALAEAGSVGEQARALLGLVSYIVDVTPLSIHRTVCHMVERT